MSLATSKSDVCYGIWVRFVVLSYVGVEGWQALCCNTTKRKEKRPTTAAAPR